jgi:sulfite oxidase
MHSLYSPPFNKVIQCNGNRREDYHFEKEGVPAFGPPHWVAGAIGCATWTGVRLRDLLNTAGMDVDAISTRKVRFALI